MSNKQKYLYRIIACVLAAAMILCCILFFSMKKKMPAATDVPTQSQTTQQPVGDAPPEGAPPVSGTTAPNEDVDWEDVPISPISGSGEYDNSKQVFFQFNMQKDTIYVGLGENKTSDALYLNINGKVNNPRSAKVGYYISAETGSLSYSRDAVHIEWQDKNAKSAEVSQYGNFVFTGRYYTDVIPIDYRNEEDYGVSWTNDIMFGGIEGQGTIIHVRAIAPEYSMFLCAFDINTDYDAATQSYYIKSITSSDVMSTQQLSAEAREVAVNSAADFLEENLVDNTDSTWKQAAIVGATVEKVKRPYFGDKFLSAVDEDSYPAREYHLKLKDPASFIKHFPSCKNLYAVTMPVSYYGYITTYFAPWYQVHMPSSNVAYTGEGLEQKLVIIGYDPLFPNSEKTILLPYDWDGDPNA